MENSESKEKITLIRDIPARSSESYAVIQASDGKEITVRFDEVFTLPDHPGKSFLVMDLRPDQVVVQESGSKEVLTIPRQPEKTP